MSSRLVPCFGLEGNAGTGIVCYEGWVRINETFHSEFVWKTRVGTLEYFQ